MEKGIICSSEEIKNGEGMERNISRREKFGQCRRRRPEKQNEEENKITGQWTNTRQFFFETRPLSVPFQFSTSGKVILTVKLA